MVSASTARFIVGVIGNVISFGLFLSPCPTFYKIIKRKSVEEFKPDPYMVTILNCALWVFYGMPFVHPDSILVVTINGFGLVVEIVYLTIFIIYSTKQGRKKVFTFVTAEAVVFAAFAALTLIFAHGTTKRSLIVGICCDILNIMMYMSPFTIMKKVIQTKSVKYMPFWLSLAGFLNGSVWTAYALIKFDIYILVSNGLGAIGGFLQLVLYACYYSSTPKDDDEVVDDAKPTELQLSSSNAAARV